MTACGSYPTHPGFLESVKVEAEAQVKRLRNHPSIALWCGNNEDVMIGERLGLKFDSNNVTGPWDDTDFPHLIIYLKIWDGVVRKLTPDIAYWPSSPFSFGGKMANDPTTGDIHQWDGRSSFRLGRQCLWKGSANVLQYGITRNCRISTSRKLEDASYRSSDFMASLTCGPSKYLRLMRRIDTLLRRSWIATIRAVEQNTSWASIFG